MVSPRIINTDIGFFLDLSTMDTINILVPGLADVWKYSFLLSTSRCLIITAMIFSLYQSASSTITSAGDRSTATCSSHFLKPSAPLATLLTLNDNINTNQPMLSGSNRSMLSRLKHLIGF